MPVKLSWTPIILFLLIVAAIAIQLLPHSKRMSYSFTDRMFPPAIVSNYPDTNSISTDASGDLVRYGKDIFTNTAFYFGPQGIVARSTNGMNCQNCHLDAGLRPEANPLVQVASSYPRYRPRSGVVESIPYRINDCFQRSLNGAPLKENAYEMKALLSYIKWTGSSFKKENEMRSEPMPLLHRAADPDKGKVLYALHCARCHQPDGNGVASEHGYTYPPLWGPNSFTANAGMIRLQRIAAFVKHNMPFDSAAMGYTLNDEDAWDVSAFVIAQQRPVKVFPHDWPDSSKKPVDHPFGPYADPFPEKQHKFGPFDTIEKYYAKKSRR